MTRRRPRLSPAPDLFSWAPPQTTTAFAPERIRAASLAASIAKAISAALRDCGKDRAAVAAEMSAFLGEPVSVETLDKYASEAAESRVINAVRLVALIRATRDRRLLELIAAPLDWAVIERRHLPAIDLAVALERRAEIDRAAKALRADLKARGVF